MCIVCAFSHVAGNSHADSNTDTLFAWMSESDSNANTHAHANTDTLANSYTDTDAG